MEPVGVYIGSGNRAYSAMQLHYHQLNPAILYIFSISTFQQSGTPRCDGRAYSLDDSLGCPFLDDTLAAGCGIVTGSGRLPGWESFAGTIVPT